MTAGEHLLDTSPPVLDSHDVDGNSVESDVVVPVGYTCLAVVKVKEVGVKAASAMLAIACGGEDEHVGVTCMAVKEDDPLSTDV